MKVIAHAAEAKVYEKKDTIIKERISKPYRIEYIDNRLRKSRTKREANVLAKLANVVAVPKVYSASNCTIEMEKIHGKKLRDILTSRNYNSYMKKFAQILAKVHESGIIHGDPTTSNILVQKKDKELVLIDFGLSFFSQKVEDKAVDLHLVKQAIESKHNSFWEKAYTCFLKSYNPTQKKEILTRLEQVEKRGRNKH